MSIQEIEKAIEELSQSEVDQLANWITEFRAGARNDEAERYGVNLNGATLADRLGSFIGALGQGDTDRVSSSRNAGEAFTDYLVDKKRDNRL